MEKEIRRKGVMVPWCGTYKKVDGFGRYALFNKNGIQVHDDTKLLKCTVILKAPKGYTLKKVK